MLYDALFTVLTGYILGSILTAVILSKILKFPDPRQHGSKNPGTSNVVRTAGIENGIYVPSSVLALKIAKTLKCSVEDLFQLP